MKNNVKGSTKMQKRIWFTLLLTVCLLFGGCAQSGGEEALSRQEHTREAQPDSRGSDLTAGLEVHYIDVGQGDATLIKCGEHAMLIDAGNNYMGTKVQMYLDKQGVESLDYVVGTHPDADHIGGLDVIVYKYDCGTIFMPAYEKDTKTYLELEEVIRNKNQKITYPIPGADYTLGEAEFTILAPNSNDYGGNANNYSIALRLTYGDTHFLFTGDAESESEEEMLDCGMELSADVYKAAHHGSSSASTESFLDAIAPAYAVISCGEDNSYGHPHAEVMNSLRQRGVRVFRTDEQGSIIASSDGTNITWNCASDDSWKAGERREADREYETKEQEDAQSYILNTNTKKFHLPECRSVEQIKEKNCQESSKSREELIQMGYGPCGNCHP